MSVGERGLHERIAAAWVAAGERRGVVVGPGDDTACVGFGDGSGGGRVLVTTDQLVGGRHFVQSGVGGAEEGAGVSWSLVARKALGRSLSDIAAMAGTPRYAVVTACLPEGFAESEALLDGFERWSGVFSCPVVGGDIATYDGAAVVLTTTVLGEAHATRGPVLRSGARVGDGVYVTGCVGGSLRSGDASQTARTGEDDGVGWHLMFEPRVEVGRMLADALGEGLRAMIDVSDGVGVDGGRLAAASGVGVEIDGESLPLRFDDLSVRAGLGDGEDYELLFTAEPADDVIGRVSGESGVAITRIGRVVAGEGTCVALIDGERVDAASIGWEHR